MHVCAEHQLEETSFKKDMRNMKNIVDEQLKKLDTAEQSCSWHTIEFNVIIASRKLNGDLSSDKSYCLWFWDRSVSGIISAAIDEVIRGNKIPIPISESEFMSIADNGSVASTVPK